VRTSQHFGHRTAREGASHTLCVTRDTTAVRVLHRALTHAPAPRVCRRRRQAAAHGGVRRVCVAMHVRRRRNALATTTTHAPTCVCGGNEDKPVHMRCVFLYMTPSMTTTTSRRAALRARARASSACVSLAARAELARAKKRARLVTTPLPSRLPLSAHTHAHAHTLHVTRHSRAARACADGVSAASAGRSRHWR
jgi:hypothetical protein